MSLTSIIKTLLLLFTFICYHSVIAEAETTSDPIDIDWKTSEFIGIDASTAQMAVITTRPKYPSVGKVTVTKLTEITSSLKAVRNYRFYGGDQALDFKNAKAIHD